MRKALALLLLFLSLPAHAGGIALQTGNRFEFTDCAAGGSAAQTLTNGMTYLLRITDTDVTLCFAETGSTCVTLGEKFPAGTVILFTVTGATKSVSCRSTSSTGDAIFTAAP